MALCLLADSLVRLVAGREGGVFISSLIADMEVPMVGRVMGSV
jgi:hypothetical protein